MLRHSIDKSLQRLHDESLNWNLRLKTNNDKSYILYCCYFYQDQLLRFYQFYRKTVLIISNLQNDFHQGNLSFACLQFYKHNFLNILAGNMFCCMQLKN